ncbi:MAG: Rrf2 family transcriptional regulator [Thomasclavelia ramosa]
MLQGVQGGFKLKKHPKDISIFSIIDIFEPTIRINSCLEEDKYCSRFATETCPVEKFIVQCKNILKNI